MDCLRPLQCFLLIPVLLLATTGWSAAEEAKKKSTPAKDGNPRDPSPFDGFPKEKKEPAPTKQAESQPNYKFLVTLSSVSPKVVPVQAPSFSAVDPQQKANSNRAAYVLETAHTPKVDDKNKFQAKTNHIALKCDAITLETLPAEAEEENYQIQCTGPVELTISGREGRTQIIAQGLEYSKNQITLTDVQVSSDSLDFTSETIRLNFPVKSVTVQPFKIEPVSNEPFNSLEPLTPHSAPTFDVPRSSVQGVFNPTPIPSR